MPRDLPGLRSEPEPGAVLLPRWRFAGAVRRVEEPEGEKGVDHAESETTRVEVPPGQTAHAQEAVPAGRERVPAVQVDQAAARGVPDVRDLQGPGSHRQVRSLTPSFHR